MVEKNILLGREHCGLICSKCLCKPIDFPMGYGCRSSAIISATFQFMDSVSGWLLLTFGAFFWPKSLCKLMTCISIYCHFVMMQNRRHSSLFVFQYKLCYAAVQQDSILFNVLKAIGFIPIAYIFLVSSAYVCWSYKNYYGFQKTTLFCILQLSNWKALWCLQKPDKKDIKQRKYYHRL